MAGNLEQIILEILLKDRASEGLGRTSGAARLAGDSVSTLNKKLDEVSKKTAEARVKLAGDKEAQASLDRLDTKLLSLDRRTANPRITVEGAARALAEISAVDAELGKLGGKGGTAETAAASLGKGAGGLAGPYGMGALIGAGVALAPVIATVGVGLAGFAAAAYSAIAPIEKAAGKTGGLAANMAKLNPEQRALATSVLGLGRQYHQFQKELQPEVLGVFNQGIRLAGHLLHDVQPVAQATGKALGGLLGRVDAEFASQRWQQFFGFMAREAGPDVQLLGNLFVQLADDLPPLLTQLQPLAEGFLKDTTAILKLVDATTHAVAWEHQHADAVSHSTGWLGRFEHAAVGAFGQMFPGVKAAKLLQDQLGKTGGTTDSTGRKIQGMGAAAQAAAAKVQTLAQQVHGLTDTENKALSPLLAYTNAVLTQRDDAKKLADALKASHDRIGLQTDVQRASFGAAQTYIQDLLNTAAAADKSHRGIDAQISSIRGALPMLRNVKGGTREYWQEVQTLVNWLHRLQLIKQISETVKVYGNGQWTVPAQRSPSSGPGGGHALAGGGRIPGYGGGDRWPALLEGGEAVVDKQTTAVHAAELRAWGVPGFAGGGIIPSYRGAPGGLVPWGQHNWQATIAGITAGLARAMAAQFAATAGGGPGGIGNYRPGAGVAQWRGVVSQALSLAGSSQQLVDSVLYQMQTESGGNPTAVNKWDSNWIAGHPSVGLMQVIAGTFAAYAGRFLHTGPFAYGVSENPLANVYAAIKYAQANYGPGLRNAYGGIGTGRGYDQGGWLPPGLSLAWNGTGKPERVGGGGSTYIINITLPPGSDREQGRRIVGYIREFEKGSGKGWRTP